MVVNVDVGIHDGKGILIMASVQFLCVVDKLLAVSVKKEKKWKPAKFGINAY